MAKYKKILRKCQRPCKRQLKKRCKCCMVNSDEEEREEGSDLEPFAIQAKPTDFNLLNKTACQSREGRNGSEKRIESKSSESKSEVSIAALDSFENEVSLSSIVSSYIDEEEKQVEELKP